MSYSKSPLNFNFAGIAAKAVGRGGQLNPAKIARLERMASRGGLFGGRIAQNILDKYRASQTQTAGVAGAATAPSAVQTAGATNMGQRINTIESRLSTLESGSDSAGAAPAETFTDPLTGMEIQRGATGNGISPEARVEAAQTRRDERAMLGTVQPQAPAVEEPIIPQSEQLGSLMASPFMVRQRKNMGPLNLNSPLNGNTFAKAVQDAKATGASTFKVGGKTYNVK
jgi:hypothetical protein